MRLHVHFSVGGIKVDEIIEGDRAEVVVGKMQQRAAAEANFLVGAFIKRMTPLQFAQEATRRYNAASGENSLIPATYDDFVKLVVAKNLATALDD